MRPFLASAANSYDPNRIHPALTSFADECCGMLARLTAYMGTLALLGIVGVYLWDRLPEIADPGHAADAGWKAASRPHPAFAASQADSSDKPASYEILRHPGGGRKDIFRWGSPEAWPAAGLEIHRPGGELGPSRLVTTDRAEFKRDAGAPSAIATDWVTAAQNPLLRGAL